MGELFDRVRSAVRENRYLFSDHADNMLRERAIQAKLVTVHFFDR